MEGRRKTKKETKNKKQTLEERKNENFENK